MDIEFRKLNIQFTYKTRIFPSGYVAYLYTVVTAATAVGTIPAENHVKLMNHWTQSKV